MKSWFGRVSTINGTATLLYSSSRWSRPMFSCCECIMSTDQTFHQFYDVDTKLGLYWIASGFHGCSMPAGNAYSSGQLVPSLFRNLLMIQLLRPIFPKLTCLSPTFHFEYPSVLSRFCLANQVNHTSWVAVFTPTDRPKSVRNRCLIELLCGVVCVFTLPFWYFRGCRGFCHRTESDLLLFVLQRRPEYILSCCGWNLVRTTNSLFTFQ